MFTLFNTFPNIRSISLTVALVAGLLICAATRPVEAQKPPGNFSGGPKTIASKERVSILIDREVEATKSFIILKISVPTDSKINAFLLSDPARLVIDFEGASVKKSENFAAPANGVIKQVRLGAHPEKLRIVVDLIQSTAPEYEWKAGKRQAIIKFVESIQANAPAAPQPATPQAAPPQALIPPVVPSAPTAAPSQPAQAISPATPTPFLTATPTMAAIMTPTPSPTETTGPTLSDVEEPAPKGVTNAGSAPKATLPDYDSGTAEDTEEIPQALGDLERSKPVAPAQKVATSFTITGYKFERLADKSPVLKITLNKPKAQAEISKVDQETYKIIVRDCGLANDELELPQFPPHDFVGFVMVVAEPVGKDTEISVSTEGDLALTTSVNEQEIWVKKP